MDTATSALSRNRRTVTGAVYAAALVVLVGWLAYTPAGLLGKADAVGYAVCHRIDLRSFHIGGRAISFCARCTGMYLGAVLGFIYLQLKAARHGGRTPLSVNIALGLIAAVFIGDSLNSFSNLIPQIPSLYTTTNTIRIFAGTGFGIIMAIFIFPAFNQTVWNDWKPEPAVGSLRALLPLLALGVVIALLVLTENPLFLYPASLISAFGVILILTMVYSMAALIFVKKENFALSFRGLILPLVTGFTLAILQVAAADTIRFLLTGTWEGFHFGG